MPKSNSIILNQREIDVLYETLCNLDEALKILRIPYLLIAGSLLGAIRSQSILFNDDDIDVALLCDDDATYRRVREELPGMLNDATAKIRPCPFCDKIRPKKLSHVWIDIFVLRRYNSMSEVLSVISTKDNGRPQSESYIAHITSPILESNAAFPLYHYDTRKGMELWPREFLLPHELFPIQSSPFGHLVLPVPASPLHYLYRSYGPNCMTHYPHPGTGAHLYVKEFQKRVEALCGMEVEGAALLPDSTVSSERHLAPTMLPLKEEHYLPIQHSKLGIATSHCRDTLCAVLGMGGVEGVVVAAEAV